MDVIQRGSYKEENSDEEEVTETRVVGVTESGVLRKRSIKRKVTKGGKLSKLRGYGNSKSDYDRIVSILLEQKMVQESIATLKERLKMVVLMHDDCIDLVSQWESVREKKQIRNHAFDLELFMFIFVGFLILAGWLFIRWYW